MPNNFMTRVYGAVAAIPRGKVATYGQLAMMAGNPRASRIVGCAMAKSPPGLPCHRVVYRDGSLCTGDCFGGRGVQRMMLESEGVGFCESGKVILRVYCWNP